MFERAVTNSAKQGVLEYRHFINLLPAWVDPADIQFNSKKAILSRAQINLNKPIQQASAEFGANPCCRSDPQHSGLPLCFPGPTRHSWRAPRVKEEFLLWTQTWQFPSPRCCTKPPPQSPSATRAAKEPRPRWLAHWPLTALSPLLLQAYMAWRRFKKCMISDSGLPKQTLNSKTLLIHARLKSRLVKIFPWARPAPFGSDRAQKCSSLGTDRDDLRQSWWDE